MKIREKLTNHVMVPYHYQSDNIYTVGTFISVGLKFRGLFSTKTDLYGL